MSGIQSQTTKHAMKLENMTLSENEKKINRIKSISNTNDSINRQGYRNTYNYIPHVQKSRERFARGTWKTLKRSKSNFWK